MLDPLTSLSIACSVMQVISFSHEMTAVIKRIKKDGTIDASLQENADQLSDSSQSLHTYLLAHDGNRLPKNQSALWDVASKCLKTSNEIQAKLDKINKTRGGSIARALKLYWAKSEFARLEKDMQNYQNHMQSQVLLHLCNHSDASILSQSEEFRDHNQMLREFIEAYSQGQEALKELISTKAWYTQRLIVAANESTKKEIKAEHQLTRRDNRTALEDLESRSRTENQRTQVLESLRDRDMYTRKFQIERGQYTKTFSSVFDEQTGSQWKGFTDWLRSDASLYWISGKAGSGKSTFINFLIEEPRTKEELDKWMPNCAIYSHFIWSAGTPYQRSIDGLLRSLVYQVLDTNNHVLDKALQDEPRFSKFRNPEDWSRRNLELLLRKSLHWLGRGVCIFLDGLDEIDPDEGPFVLINLIKQISLFPDTKGIKLCVSSRREESFKQGLGELPNLRLQDLTRFDMQAYAKEFLQASSLKFEGVNETAFIDEIVDRAEGVFLWVSLVLKSLQRGNANGDDPKKLMERLQTLPSDLEKLYETMLERLGDDQAIYRTEVAMYFNMFLTFDKIVGGDSSEWNLFHFAAAVDPTLRQLLLVDKLPPSSKVLKEILIGVNRRLTSRCAGLLETFCSWEKETESDIGKILARDGERPWDYLEITLIHRSAKDFLLSNEKTIMGADKTTPSERTTRALQAFALEDLYPPDEHLTVEIHKALEQFHAPDVGISDEQKRSLFNLTKDIYQRNNWPDIYERAAFYAIDLCMEPLDALIKSRSKSVTPIANYLLICMEPEWNQRTDTMVASLLAKGGNSNVLQLTCMRITKYEHLICVLPVLGHYLASGLKYERIENTISSFLRFGANIGLNFLSYEGGYIYFRSWDWRKTRPHNYMHMVDVETTIGFIVELNPAYLIQQAIRDSSENEAQRSAIASRLGLPKEREHYRKLLYVVQGRTFYSVSEDQSQALDTADEKRRNRKGDKTDCINTQTYDSLITELKVKENEVKDVRQWLIDNGRGHMIAEESDIAGISAQTSFDEMVNIYEKLNEKYKR